MAENSIIHAKHASVDDELSANRIEMNYPLPSEDKIPTMGRKLIIQSCIPGWQPIKWYKDRGIRNLPPISIEDQAEAIIDAVKAGASVIHTHPRDPDTGEPKKYAPKLLANILDRAFGKVDFVTFNAAWLWDFKKSPYVDYISYTNELLKMGKGNKYIQGSTIMTYGIHHYGEPEHGGQPFIDGIRWLEKHNVKPIYDISESHFPRIKNLVFDSGVSTWKPYVIQLHKEPYFSEWWAHVETIKNIHITRNLLPDSCVGVFADGRHWLPVAVQGIIQGCEIVRVGIEEQFYLWPHRDDIATRATQTTELIAAIAKALGKEIATPTEARQILGLKFTSNP